MVLPWWKAFVQHIKLIKLMTLSLNLGLIVMFSSRWADVMLMKDSYFDDNFPLAFWPGIKGENNFGKRLIASWVAKISATILWPTHWRSRFKADDVAFLDDFQHETGNSSTMSIGIRRPWSTGLDIRTKLNPRWKHAKKTNVYIMWKPFVKSWLYWWWCWNMSNIHRLFRMWSKTWCQIVCTMRFQCVSKILTPRGMLQKTWLIAKINLWTNSFQNMYDML